MIELLDQCYKETVLYKKFRIFTKFLNKYGTIAITVNGDIMIVPSLDVDADSFIKYKYKFEKDINNCIKSSIDNN